MNIPSAASAGGARAGLAVASEGDRGGNDLANLESFTKRVNQC